MRKLPLIPEIKETPNMQAEAPQNLPEYEELVENVSDLSPGVKQTTPRNAIF